MRAKRARPPAWFFRDDEPEPGAVWCVDIDGVLADATHRQSFVTGGTRKWGQFFAAASGDSLLDETASLVKRLDPDIRVAIVTARPESISELTIDWLERFEVRWDLLLMRQQNDWRPSARMKASAVVWLRARALEPVHAIDDDRRNLEMYEQLGIATSYVHSGYYD